MKVRCVRLIDSRGASVERSPIAYHRQAIVVLSLSFGTEGVLLGLIGDGRSGVAIFGLDEFEIVSPVIPSNWIVVAGAGSTVQFAPAPWTKQRFWERYYDGDPTLSASLKKKKNYCRGELTLAAESAPDNGEKLGLE